MNKVTGAFDKESIILSIDYHQPCAWRELLDFLEPRAVEGIEDMRDEKYHRVVSLNSNSEIHNGFLIHPI